MTTTDKDVIDALRDELSVMTEAYRHADANTARWAAQVHALEAERDALKDTARAALSEYDAMAAKCPIRPGKPAPDHCPNCGADAHQNCGVYVSAMALFITAHRTLLNKDPG